VSARKPSKPLRLSEPDASTAAGTRPGFNACSCERGRS
jgi:hypothetical protein